MAAGDDAAAAGMDVVAQTGYVRQGATEINKTRDYVADVKRKVTVGAVAPTAPRIGDLWVEPI